MDCINFSLEGENLCDDHLSWAAKNYECTFCKRKFRSAQALGGHMNVHRRDRARLRLLPSTLSSECPHHSPNPNPNPYFTSSSSLSAPSKFLPHNYSSCQSLISPSLRTLVSTPSSYADDHENNKKPKFELSPQISHVHNCNPKKGMRGVDEKILKGSFAQKDVDDEFNKVDLKEESNIIRQDMDLEMGLLKDFHKKEVDLELRLGHL